MLLPDAGIVVIEVKGGSVWFGDRDGGVTDEPGWWQQGGGVHRIDPVKQAIRVKYAVRDYVESYPRWSRGHVVWARTRS